SEVIHPCRKACSARALFRWQVSAHDVKLDLVKGASAGSGTKECFSLGMFLASRDSSSKKQQLRQRLNVWNGFAFHRCVRGGNCRKRRPPGLAKVPSQTGHFQCGIDLEQQRFIVPIESMGMHPDTEVGMLGSAVILPRSIQVIVVAQKDWLLRSNG